jgi:hypothetical protein
VDWEIDEPEVQRGIADRHFVRGNRRRAVIQAGGVARFGVADGAQIIYEPAPDAHPGDIEAYLHASVTAMLLAQQGRFALHATLVRAAGADVALGGPQAVGKSTTALALTQRGHRILCDDVTPLESRDGQTFHLPTSRPVRVTPAAAAALGLDTSAAPEPGPRAEKLALPCSPAESAPLDAIVILKRHPGETTECELVPPRVAVRVLSRHVYRRPLLEPWRAEVFTWAAAIAATVPVYLLARPATGWSLEAVVQAIEYLAGALT